MYNQGTYMPGDSTQHHKEEEKSMIIQPMQVELGPESTPQAHPGRGQLVLLATSCFYSSTTNLLGNLGQPT